MHPLLSQLKYCLENRIPVSLFSDLEDPERFSVGYLRAVDEDFVLIDCLDDLGAYFGLNGIKTELVYSLIYNDRYTESIAAANAGGFPALESLSEEKSLRLALVYALQRQLIVDFEYNNSGSWDISGYVEDLDGRLVALTPLNDKGERDGRCFLDLSVLSRIQVCPESRRKEGSKLLLLKKKEK